MKRNPVIQRRSQTTSVKNETLDLLKMYFRLKSQKLKVM